MDMDNFTPYIRYAADHITDPGFRLERAIFDFELIFLKSGRMRYAVDGRDYRCEEGDILFLRPGRNHIVEEIDGIIHQPHVHFDFYREKDSADIQVSFKKTDDMTQEERSCIRRDITGDFPVILPDVIHLHNPYLFEEELMELIQEFTGLWPFKEYMLKAHFMKLWGILCREYYWSSMEGGSRYRSEMAAVKNYLVQNMGKNITLDELSGYVNISKYHLIRLFGAFYGEPPMRYLNYIRLARAKELLQYTSATVQAIGEQLGFASIHSFSRWFKGQEGASPSCYRRNRKLG